MPPRRTMSVPRQSRRQRGLPPSDEYALYQPEAQFIASMRVNVRKKIKYNITKGEDLGEWAYHVDRSRQRQRFFPGQIILAMHAHPQTVLSKAFDDKEIGQTDCGPVAAKMRVMVVLTESLTGFLCLPMYTHGTSTPLPQGRWEEMVSISNDHRWAGNTRWCGLPLRMTMHDIRYAKNSFIHLTEPIHVLLESRIHDIGYMTGGEYCKLMDLVQYKEDELRRQAFQRYGETYFKHPQHTWWPAPGQRLTYNHVQQRMNTRTHMRWRRHG